MKFTCSGNLGFVRGVSVSRGSGPPPKPSKRNGVPSLLPLCPAGAAVEECFQGRPHAALYVEPAAGRASSNVWEEDPYKNPQARNIDSQNLVARRGHSHSYSIKTAVDMHVNIPACAPPQKGAGTTMHHAQHPNNSQHLCCACKTVHQG